MKYLLIILFILFNPIDIAAQNATITIGRGTDCFGRGACSISSESSNNYNSTFLVNINGATTLRILRTKLTQSEENQLFGVSSRQINIGSTWFIMDQGIEIDSELKPHTSQLYSKQLDSLKQGHYPTIITREYIDIQIITE